MKILVVDDEPVARQRIVRLLTRALAEGEAPHEVREAGSAKDALAALGAFDADAMLLDVEMPGIDGLTLAALPTLPPVIFVTAHSDRALAAFEVGAIDYLVKPVSAERLERALDRVRARQAPDPAVSAAEPTERVEATETWRLTVVDGSLRRFVDAREVSSFNADEKYVRFSIGGREHLLRESLDALEERLVAHGFLRAHRGALVRRSAVEAFDQSDGSLVLTTGERVPVSRRCLPSVRTALGIT